MLDLNKCRVSPSGNIITPKCRLSFPNLFVAKKFDDSDMKPKFGTSLLIPPTADIDLLIQAAKAAAHEKFGSELPKKLRSPFLKADDFDSLAEDAPGFVLLRVSGIQKPGIVNAKGENVSEESEVYPGRWCVASLRAYGYDHPKGGKGVSFGLQNIQLLDHDEPLGGRARAENEFEPVAEAGDPAAGKASADSVFG